MTKPLSVLLAVLLLLFTAAASAQDDELLEPSRAFAFSAEAQGPDTVRAQWQIAPGYHLYRNRIHFETDTPGVELGAPQFPQGKIEHDEFFGQVETYRNTLAVDVPVIRKDGAGSSVHLIAHSQGCADLGVCYPPQRQVAQLSLPAAAPAQPQASGGEAVDQLAQLGDNLGLGGGDQQVLDPDQAFAFSAQAVGPDRIEAHWDIAQGHYLYRNKFKFQLKDAQGVQIGEVKLPRGQTKQDEFFGKIEVFHNSARAEIPLQRSGAAARSVTLQATYQGCAESGICYPPITRTASLKLPAGAGSTAGGAGSTAGGAGSAAGGAGSTAGGVGPAGGGGRFGSPSATAEVTPAPGSAQRTPAASAQAGPASGGGEAFVSEQDRLARFLENKPLWISVGIFFLAGLALAFTPCVFPMIPILSSIIAGQGEKLTTRHAFSMSLVYVMAMAVTYTIAGVVVALLGANLQAAFQDPWVLSVFAGIFVLLSLAMFGFYDLQMPSGIQSRLSEFSNRQHGGTMIGVAIMGVLSALIVGPCVAAPLIAALLVISQTGDVVLGGTALFALSLGMGAPLIVIGTSAGKLLPRAGGWMDAVKAVFGVMLLALAIWMLERILPETAIMVLWAVLLMISAVYMGALEPMREGISGWYRLWKGMGLIFLVYGTLLLVGAAAGSRDYLQPLQGIFAQAGGTGGAAAQTAELQFRKVKSVDDLDREIAAAAARNQPVMLDFYADWCVSCKEYEKYTFSNPQVKQALQGVVLLQADVTANNAQDKALLHRFGLIGPPSILFFGPNGQERQNYRLVGFLDAGRFRSHVEKAL